MDEQVSISSAEFLKKELLAAAEQNRASDIHIEPTHDSLLIRLRVDGTLRLWARRPLLEAENFISYLKIAGGLDITQHVVPQEGHFASESREYDEKGTRRMLDIRASFFPTIYGEAVVLRLLNRSDLLIPFEELGFSKEHTLPLLRDIIYRGHGMVLVAGPVNSGKTTTLYSILNELASENKNIITLEDPVEYYLDFARQSQIRAHQGYTFAVGLRSILRQDPDIIMVGEIRDFETAENAFRASLTGRMLFSTIHSNSTLGTVSRLIDMNIERDLIAYALNAVISKRLVKQICENCRVPYQPSKEVMMVLSLDQGRQYFRGQGCEQCSRTGVKGRVGLYEVLVIDEEIRRMIIEKVPSSDMLTRIKERGTKTLREEGVEKIYAGVITPEDALKAIS